MQSRTPAAGVAVECDCKRRELANRSRAHGQGGQGLGRDWDWDWDDRRPPIHDLRHDLACTPSPLPPSSRCRERRTARCRTSASRTLLVATRTRRVIPASPPPLIASLSGTSAVPLFVWVTCLSRRKVSKDTIELNEVSTDMELQGSQLKLRLQNTPILRGSA